ncbi:MAG: alanine:cation symporter family protein [Clostridiales bacterium]|nr:alanine:cation symporter family protein [Clostridiales bacterium]
MLEAIIKFIGEAVWGPPMLGLFLFTGLLFTVKSGFFQFRGAGTWISQTIISALKAKNRRSGDGISEFQTLCSALAACIGTGNIVGVATAIYSGGPGAVFWMWASAALGMMTAYAENVLGIKYRTKNALGEWCGGAMIYMQRGLGFRRTAKVFSVFCVAASLATGNMTQANSVSDALKSSFGISPVLSGAVCSLLAAFVIFGGVKRIASVSEKTVPLMSAVFLGLSFAVLFVCRDNLIPAVRMIFSEAFTPRSLMGFGTFKAMRYGVARGVFSNEAGLGSTAIIHCETDTDSPERQGMWGILEVFIDTIFMCTVTALVILCSGAFVPGNGVDAAALSAAAYSAVFPAFGGRLLSLLTAVFAFASLVGWSVYGKKCFGYLTDYRYPKLYTFIYIVLIFAGCAMKPTLMWNAADILNGFMALPNLISLILLSRQVTIPEAPYMPRQSRRPQCRNCSPRC